MYFQENDEELKDVNMWPVGLGNTRISIDYALKGTLDIALALSKSYFIILDVTPY